MPRNKNAASRAPRSAATPARGRGAPHPATVAQRAAPHPATVAQRSELPAASAGAPARPAHAARLRLPAPPARLRTQAVHAALSSVRGRHGPANSPLPRAPRALQRMEQKIYRDINSREFCCGSMPMATHSVQTCLAVIVHDAKRKMGCLGHIDTDVAEDLNGRYELLARAIREMMNALGAESPVIYALSNMKFDMKILSQKLDNIAIRQIEVDSLNKKAIVYHPDGGENCVKVLDDGPVKSELIERKTSYETMTQYEEYEDHFCLFRVKFEEQEETLVLVLWDN